MYLIDTNVISELRNDKTADRGVIEFMSTVTAKEQRCYLSVITVGELHMGAAKIQHRGDTKQFIKLNEWIDSMLKLYGDFILPIDQEVSLIWAALRVPHHENALDKLIAATALSHSLTLVTRNTKDFAKTGVPLFNPFSASA